MDKDKMSICAKCRYAWFDEESGEVKNCCHKSNLEVDSISGEEYWIHSLKELNPSGKCENFEDADETALGCIMFLFVAFIIGMTLIIINF